jgi:hypothetical protein
MLCLAGSIAVVAASTVVYFAAPLVLRKPRSVSDQINAQLNRLIDHGRNHVVVNERLQLHPTDDPSWVVMIENSPNAAKFGIDSAAGRPANDPLPTSDELRIYDVDDGWLNSQARLPARGSGNHGSALGDAGRRSRCL